MAFDFPSSPSAGAIYTPAGGPTYTWDGSGWTIQDPVVALPGAYKLNEGTTGVQATLDVTLPPGYLSHELLINGLVPTTNGVGFVAQLSANGTTFDGSANYFHAGLGARMNSTSIFLSYSGNNGFTIFGQVGTGYCAHLKVRIPQTVDKVPWIFWDGGYWDSIGQITWASASGINQSFSGPTLAIRFVFGVGNIAAGARWQLNGIK